MVGQFAPLSSLRRRLAAQDGFALVLALGAMLALGLVTSSVVFYSSANYSSTGRSKADTNALALAEAGLNYAYSTLAAAPDPSVPTALPEQTVQLDGGTATYSGTFDAASRTWTLTGTGRVHNPAGSADVVRSVHGRAKVSGGAGSGSYNGAWNYIFADDPNSCATLNNSSSIKVPLYVRGNLCLNNSSTIDGYALQVGGHVSVLGSQAGVGMTSPLREVHAAGGCSTDGVNFHTPCSAADRVNATLDDTNVAPLTKPQVDIASWYANAQPGPLHGCTLGSFPGGFDNDSVLNHSRGPVDLTPNQAYDCQVRDASGTLVGRIAWSGGKNGTLTILGTIFFDGDIVFTQLVNATYQGRATIYTSGVVTMSNQTNLCPVGGCRPTWDPSQNLLTFVAGSSTAQVGFSIDNKSTFAGAVYAVNDYSAGNNASVWGPVIARQIYMTNSTLNVYPPITDLLPGMPGSSNTAPTTVAIDPGSWGY